MPGRHGHREVAGGLGAAVLADGREGFVLVVLGVFVAIAYGVEVVVGGALVAINFEEEL